MSTMTAAYHCMILVTFATWGSVGHISPITVVVQVRQVLVHQVQILAGQIFQAYIILQLLQRKMPRKIVRSRSRPRSEITISEIRPK